jgi:hypothetical protein
MPSELLHHTVDKIHQALKLIKPLRMQPVFIDAH